MPTIKHLLGSLCLMLSLAAPSSASAAPAEQTAVFAGGCFWGVDAVFKHVKGVSEVVSGYAGGSAATARYEQVSNGNTGHAEAVRVQFNPEQVSYQQLLQVFFSVAHDPTQLNRQGPDVGTQYRSAIFYSTDEEKQIIEKLIAQLKANGYADNHVMLTEDSLFMSNGTNVYSKFHFISEGIGSYGKISLYDPASGHG